MQLGKYVNTQYYYATVALLCLRSSVLIMGISKVHLMIMSQESVTIAMFHYVLQCATETTFIILSPRLIMIFSTVH